MKGRTTCPKCEHEFVVDAPSNCKKLEVTCSKCNHKFKINLKPSTSSSDECSWEEHGEPRKTILSSIKPKTDKPKIVTILLIIAFISGISTAAFSEDFVITSTNILSNMGLKGSVELYITDNSNETLHNVTIEMGDITDFTYNNDHYSVGNVNPGIQTIVLTLPGYTKVTQEILVLPFIPSSHNIKMEMGPGETTLSFGTIGCSLIILLLSIFPLIAAFTSWRRRHFDVAIAGSLIGIFSFGFFIGSILCIISFIILLLSREEFENGEKGKIF